MTEQERQHFDMLREGPCASPEYIKEFYGLTWPQPDDAREDFKAWAGRLKRRPDCPDDWVSRYEIESFMQQKGLIPKKWVGARLGMKVAPLEKLLDVLGEIQMRRPRYEVYSELMATSFVEDLVPNLPGLRFRTFSDHNSFCERLHADLKDALGLEVPQDEKLFCATSTRMEDYPRLYASDFDCLTLEPLSVRHQMWLDFRKPLNLWPDRCSKLLYVDAENRETLRPFCAGAYEPDGLEQYTRFLAVK